MKYAKKEYTTGKGGILDYFNPTSNNGKNFWSTPFAQVLAKLQGGVNYMADKPRVNLQNVNPLRNTPIAPVGSFGSAMAQDIINTPSNLFRSGRQIGQDYSAGRLSNPKVLLSDLGQAGSPLLNIATLGVGSSLAKQTGKQTLKQVAKRGALEGGILGGAYGTATGLETGRETEDNSEYFKNLLASIGMGTGLGATLGAATPIVSRGVSNLLKGYKASPLASQAGFIDPNAKIGKQEKLMDLGKSDREIELEGGLVKDNLDTTPYNKKIIASYPNEYKTISNWIKSKPEYLSIADEFSKATTNYEQSKAYRKLFSLMKQDAPELAKIVNTRKTQDVFSVVLDNATQPIPEVPLAKVKVGDKIQSSDGQIVQVEKIKNVKQSADKNAPSIKVAVFNDGYDYTPIDNPNYKIVPKDTPIRESDYSLELRKTRPDMFPDEVPIEPVAPLTTEIPGVKTMADILKNKKIEAPKAGLDLLKEDYRSQYQTQGPNTFDDTKFEKWWDVLSKNLSEDELVTGLNSGLIANRGSQGSIIKTNEYLKMLLERKGVQGKWRELWKEADESLMNVEPPVVKAGFYDTKKGISDTEIGDFRFSGGLGVTGGKAEPIIQNGKIVGGINVDKSGYGLPKGMAYVRGLEISPEFRNQGIGSDAIKNVFKNNPKITALRGNATPETIDFWKKQGAIFDDKFQPTMFTIEKPRVAQPTIVDAKLVKMPKPETVAEIIKKPEADWETTYTEIGDRATQNLYSILDDIQKKGVTIEQFADMVDNPDVKIPVNLEKSVKLYDDTLKALKEMYKKKTGKDVGEVERYMPHVREDTPDVTKLGQTFFDKLDQEFGFGKTRTGTMTDYVMDPFYAAQRYIDQVRYQLFRPQIESAKTGRPIEALLKEEEIIQKVSQAADDPKKYDELKLLEDLIDKGEKEGKDIIDMDVDYGVRTQLLRDDARKFKIAGIWKEAGFEAHRNAEAYAGTIMTDSIKPTLKSGNTQQLFSVIAKELPDYNIARLNKYLEKGDFATIEGIVGTQLKKKYRRDGINQITEYLSTHRFHGRIKEDLERKAKNIMVLEKREQDLIDSTLGHIRSTVGRAALGLNLRTSVNNMMEPKRAIALGSKEDYGEALKFAGDPRNVKGILERYGISVGKNVQDIIDTQFKKTKRSGAIEKIDKNIIYGPFNATEGWKDAIFLRVFENEGKKQNLAGKELVDFVMHRFDYYGHKYGEYGTLGLFTNRWAKTALQFAQYPMKEAGIYADMIERGSRPIRNKMFGGNLDTKASRQAQAYLAKITVMNAMIYGALSGLYGISKSEVFGALPFNIQPSENGFQVNISPLVSLAQDIGWGVINAKSDAEENGESFDPVEIFSRKAKRTLATTVIPAGNQLINKTGIQNFDPTGITDDFFTDSALSDMERGFNPSASGNVRFLSPTDPVNSIAALTMGPYATDQSREYFNEDGRYLSANDTQTFKDLFAGDPEVARTYYNSYQQGLKDKKVEDKLVADIISGKKSPDALAGTEAENTVVQGANNKPQTISEILMKDQAERDKQNGIMEIWYGDKYKNQPEEVKQALMQQNGWTQADKDNAEIKKLSNLSVKDRASFISTQENPDWVNLYKQEIVSLDVLKELQRTGKIPDAEALWDKIKMSDPYVQQEAIKDLRDKYLEKTFKLQKQHMDEIFAQMKKANNASVKSTYNPPTLKPYKVKGPSASIKNMLTDPTNYKLGEYKKVSVKF